MRTTITRLTALLLAAVLIAATLAATTLLPTSGPWQTAAYAAETDAEADHNQQEGVSTIDEESDTLSKDTSTNELSGTNPDSQGQNENAGQGTGQQGNDKVSNGESSKTEGRAVTKNDGTSDNADGGNTQASTNEPALRGPLRSSTPTWPDLEGEAYACYDSQWHYLTLFRSTDTVVDGESQTVTDITGRSFTGIIWGGIETTRYATKEDVPWHKTSDVWVKRFEIASGNTIRPLSCAWWLGCISANVSYAGLAGLDTSHCESMASMFKGCSSLYSIDVSGFDTSSCTDMSAMFSGCTRITSLDLSGFDTSNVTTMGEHSSAGGMFYNCKALATLDITGWDTSNVTDMSGLFASCYKLDPVPADQLDTSACTDMRSMFESCSAATSLDLSGFDTSHVTSMASMFYRCSKLASLDVEGIDTSQVTDMSSMFQECSALTTLDLSPLETPQVTTMAQMFWSCTSLASLDISSFDTSRVTTFKNAFYQCSSLAEVTLGKDFSFKGRNITTSSLKATLPSPPSNDTYTGKWAMQDDPDVTYLATTLRDVYDGETMAGTWVWGTYPIWPITFNLEGGSLPEGQEYPTSYIAGREYYLPGIESSELSFPVREGHRFVRWEDEEGQPCGRIEASSTGSRTFTAVWHAYQIEVRVPVAVTFTATDNGDGTTALVPTTADFSLCLDSRSEAPVTTTLTATAADGFELSGSDEPGDGQIDVWLTPVTTDADPTTSGYDPTQDATYHACDQVKLSQCSEGIRLTPLMDCFDRIWLNDLGGRMGGPAPDDGSDTLFAQISWTFAIAPQS